MEQCSYGTQRVGQVILIDLDNISSGPGGRHDCNVYLVREFSILSLYLFALSDLLSISHQDLGPVPLVVPCAPAWEL